MRLTLAERNRQLSSAIATCNTVFETTERQRRAAVRNLSTSLHELLPLGARVRVSIDGRPSGGIIKKSLDYSYTVGYRSTV